MRVSISKILLCGIIALNFLTADAAVSELRAGASSVEASPAKTTGSNLAGYQPRKSDGVHDPITARCLVLDDGETKMAIVTYDLIGVFYSDIQKIASAASEVSGVPADNILIHSIHTHSGPDTMGIWGGAPKSYKKILSDATSQCLANASSSMKPATAVFASGEVEGFNINRRHPENGLPDKNLSVMELRDNDNKTISVLVNFACHPVVLGGDNPKITADYVYFARKKLEDDLGGTALFVTRDIGDANPPAIHDDVYERKEGTFEMAEKIGSGIASESEKLIKSAKLAPTKIRIVKKQIEIPVTNPQFQGLIKGGLIKRELKNGNGISAVAIVDFGPAQILTFPGEASSPLGKTASNFLPGPVKFLFGQTFDEIGYIIPLSEWDGKRYEESMSLGQGTAALLENIYAELSTSLFNADR